MSDRTPLAPVLGLSRGARIPGPPQRREQAQTAAARSQQPTPAPPTQASDSTPARADTSRAPRTSRRPASPSTAGEGIYRPISLSVPAELLTQFRRSAKDADVPQADLLLDALEAHLDQLDDLVTDAARPNASSGMFLRSTTRAAGTLSTLSLRMRSENVTTLDTLVRDSGAASRSQLCVAVLRQYLG